MSGSSIVSNEVTELLYTSLTAFLARRWQAAVEVAGHPFQHHWLQIDLSRPSYICGVGIDWKDAKSRHWNIVGWSDEQHAWTPILKRKVASIVKRIKRHLIHDILHSLGSENEVNRQVV